jgi:nucleoid DNA-binding protein
LPGFGKFVLTHKLARTGHNPQTGEEIKIAARAVPIFKPSSVLKEAVAKAVKPETKGKK